MAIIAKETGGGKDFIPAPSGAHAAVCVDIVDLGVLEVTFGGKTKKQHKVYLAWQIGEDMEDGKPFTVRKRYTLSLHEKAGLRKDLESWRGRPFTPVELEGFDLEVLIGVPCMLSVLQEKKPGSNDIYANVKAIMRLPKGVLELKPRDYVRVAERPAEGQVSEPEAQPFGNITEEDVPF